MLLLLVMLYAASPGADACALLSDADVQAAVGEHVTARTPAAPPSGGLLMNQCQLVTSGTHGVSLGIASGAREYWRQQFHAQRDKRPPRAVDGIGDEAYWTGGAMAGALYALAGDRFIRVSVGGYRTEAERVEKSTMLARAVLQHLEAK